jgi:hypothetical protein
MDTCQSCGANLVDNAKFCHACGTEVGKKTWTQQFSVSADEVTKKVKELVHEGNVSKITVRDESGKSLLEIPVTAGVVGVLLAPWLAAAGAIAALATKCTIEVERKSRPSEPLVATA